MRSRVSVARRTVRRAVGAHAARSGHRRPHHVYRACGRRRSVRGSSLQSEIVMTLAALAPRADFPLLLAQPDLHYLDSAATSQKPGVVLDAIRDFYETANANPHRGAYALSAVATDAYHDARATIARFLGVGDPDCLIFTRGTTDAINLVASSWGRANIGAGDEIVISGIEHHANFVPWQQLARSTGATLRIAELTAEQEIDIGHLRSLVTPRTKLVAITQVSNAVAAITPLSEVVEIVRGT